MNQIYGKLQGALNQSVVIGGSISEPGKLIGTMNHHYGKLKGTINSSVVLGGNISAPGQLIGAAVIPFIVRNETYDGDYVVTPKVSSNVVLPTEKKLMQQDVTVLKIPQFEVSNEAGGKTLIMGDEYYG